MSIELRAHLIQCALNTAKVSYSSRPIPTRWAPWPVNRNASPAASRRQEPAPRPPPPHGSPPPAPRDHKQALALAPSTTARCSKSRAGGQGVAHIYSSRARVSHRDARASAQPEHATPPRSCPRATTAAHRLLIRPRSAATLARSATAIGGAVSTCGPGDQLGTGASSRITCALVPLIPKEETPARRGSPLLSHAISSVKSDDLARRPVHVRGGLIDVQRPWQHAVAHRHHHLDHPGHTGRRLGVADVRLDRPKPQRTLLGTILPIGGQQRLRLDRIAQRRARAMSLDRIHLAGREAGVRQRLSDHPLLGGTIGRRQPIAGAILIHGAAPHHAPTPR